MTIKGSDGAGRSAKDIDLLREIPSIRKNYPDLKIVASGGVKNREDIRRLLAAGACAVSIGTLFAMSSESSIPFGVKLKLLNATGKDIRRLVAGARQRAVIFSETETDDFNNTSGLTKGIASGTEGHIFIGNAIEDINEIASVEQIVQRLISS